MGQYAPLPGRAYSPNVASPSAPGYDWREQRGSQDWRNNTWRERRFDQDWRNNGWRQRRTNEDWQQREEYENARTPNNATGSATSNPTTLKNATPKKECATDEGPCPMVRQQRVYEYQ